MRGAGREIYKGNIILTYIKSYPNIQNQTVPLCLAPVPSTTVGQEDEGVARAGNRYVYVYVCC
jgi:hypothetical protein